MQLKILTLNLWNIREPLELRYSALLAGFQVLQPDIVCLQEVARDPRTSQIQSELIAERGGFAHHASTIFGFADKWQEGLSILSRHAIVRRTSVALPAFPSDMPRQVLLTEFMIQQQRLLVANTHLAFPPELRHERQVQVAALLPAIKQFAAQRRLRTKILCGDFNDDPGSPAVRMIVNSDLAFHDAFAACHPGHAGYTYSSKNAYADHGRVTDMRIDYVFATSDLKPQHCSIVFDGQKGLELVSDHYGVYCHLAMQNQAHKAQP
jgi:endonuclease/exonuclease/phosphatase family metal-dependent hydrolase